MAEICEPEGCFYDVREVERNYSKISHLCIHVGLMHSEKKSKNKHCHQQQQNNTKNCNKTIKKVIQYFPT